MYQDLLYLILLLIILVHLFLNFLGMLNFKLGLFDFGKLLFESGINNHVSRSVSFNSYYYSSSSFVEFFVALVKYCSNHVSRSLQLILLLAILVHLLNFF